MNTTAATTAPDTPGANLAGLGTLPDDDPAHEGTLIPVSRPQALAALQALTVDEITAALKAREVALAKLREVAIQSTQSIDWTLYRDKDGNVVGVPKDSALVVIRKWLGISVVNFHPKNASGVAEPLVSEVNDKGKKVIVVEMWADGYCAFTGERITDVYFAVRDDQQFTGRGTLQDLKASCYTGVSSKVTRILSGLRKVSSDQLVANKIDLAKCAKGAGYGTGTERTANKVVDEGVTETRKKLGEAILQCTGGDVDAARALLKICTKGDKPNADGKTFDGYDSVERLTKQWQVDQAWNRLKQQPEYSEAFAGESES